jgi:hypothetical protein
MRWAPITLVVIRGLCDFGLSVEPKSLLVVEAPGSKTAEVTVESIGNCQGVDLSPALVGLPRGVTAAFAPPSLEGTVGGTANSTMSITVSADAPNGTYPLTILASNGTYSRSAPFTLVISNAQLQTSSIGLGVAVIAIGAGAAVALAGFGVALRQQTNYCRFCGSQIPRNSRHCQSCGRRLT